jgi:hypothetical protein
MKSTIKKVLFGCGSVDEIKETAESTKLETAEGNTLK